MAKGTVIAKCLPATLTFAGSGMFTASNIFTRSNTFTQSKAFQDRAYLLVHFYLVQLCHIHLLWMHSHLFTETIIAKASLLNTVSLYIVGKSCTYISTFFIYYEYIVVHYSTYFSFYAVFFTIVYQNDGQSAVYHWSALLLLFWSFYLFASEAKNRLTMNQNQSKQNKTTLCQWIAFLQVYQRTSMKTQFSKISKEKYFVEIFLILLFWIAFARSYGINPSITYFLWRFQSSFIEKITIWLIKISICLTMSKI